MAKTPMNFLPAAGTALGCFHAEPYPPPRPRVSRSPRERPIFNHKAKLTLRKAYGFRTLNSIQIPPCFVDDLYPHIQQKSFFLLSGSARGPTARRAQPHDLMEFPRDIAWQIAPGNSMYSGRAMPTGSPP